MQRRLATLGPQQLALGGHVLRGHTFHYSTCESSAAAVARTVGPQGDPAAVAAGAGEAVYRHGSIHASYFHAWFASSPSAVAELLGAATA